MVNIGNSMESNQGKNLQTGHCNMTDNSQGANQRPRGIPMKMNVGDWLPRALARIDKTTSHMLTNASIMVSPSAYESCKPVLILLRSSVHGNVSVLVGGSHKLLHVKSKNANSYKRQVVEGRAVIVCMPQYNLLNTFYVALKFPDLRWR